MLVVFFFERVKPYLFSLALRSSSRPSWLYHFSGASTATLVRFFVSDISCPLTFCPRRFMDWPAPDPPVLPRRFLAYGPELTRTAFPFSSFLRFGLPLLNVVVGAPFALVGYAWLGLL